MDLLETIATTCDADHNELAQESWDWDADTKTRTQGILASVRNFEFAVSLVTLKNVLEPLRGITAKLQKRDLDIYEAFCNIDSAIDDVTSNRLNIDTDTQSGIRKCSEFQNLQEVKKHFLELLPNNCIEQTILPIRLLIFTGYL